VVTRFRALRFGVPEAAIVASLAAVGVVLASAWRRGGDEISREDAALARLEAIAASEAAFRAAGRLDANRDGVAEFGRLSDLAEGGALGVDLEVEADGTALAGGYRFEVQLPAGTVPGGRVALSRSGGRADPLLSSRTFVASAIPEAEEGSGLRSFVLDAEGRLFVAEGVVDPLREPRRPPPALALVGPTDESLTGQPIWRRAEPPVRR
jgi:hypothetical protein